MMTLKLKLKTIFEFSVLGSCHVPNFISVGLEMPELRRGLQCEAQIFHRVCYGPV